MTIGSILQLVGINIILSSDNAISIALAANGLEKRLKRRAIFWGSLLASGLLILMTLIANFLLMIPLASAIGGCFLLKVAFDLPHQMDDEPGESGGTTFTSAIKQIIIANLIMSFDNALAMASAAHGNYMLIAVGVIVGSIIVMGGGHVIAWLLHRYPVLVYFGAAILAHAAFSMILGDRFVRHLVEVEAYTFWGPIVGAVVLVGFSFLTKHRSRKKKKAAATDS